MIELQSQHNNRKEGEREKERKGSETVKRDFQMRFGIKSSARKAFQWKGTTLHARNCRGEGSCIKLTAEWRSAGEKKK